MGQITYQIDQLDQSYSKVDNYFLRHVLDRSTELDFVVSEQVLNESLFIVQLVDRDVCARGRNRHSQ